MARGLLHTLLLLLALASTSGLRLFVGSSRPHAVRACVHAALPKIEDARSLSTEEIEAEIVTAKKVRSRARGAAEGGEGGDDVRAAARARLAAPRLSVVAPLHGC